MVKRGGKVDEGSRREEKERGNIAGIAGPSAQLRASDCTQSWGICPYTFFKLCHGLPWALTNFCYPRFHCRLESYLRIQWISIGMGIDKPDIRNIIRYGVPENICSWAQELGL